MMGKTVRIATRSAAAPALALGALLAVPVPALAQDAGGGLVISALPSDTVIGAADPAVLQPVVVTAVTTGASPADPLLADPLAGDMRRRADQPRPSIIVGDLAILAAIGPRGPLGLPFPAREAIRQRDAALFDRLLGRGVFDPDSDRMAEAIQTELQRMECYSGSIDGDWGAGSSRAAERWLDAASVEAGTEAETGLFRAIAGRGEMRCPAIVPVQPAVAARDPDPQPRRTGNNRGNSAGGGGQPPRVVQQDPPAAVQPSTERKINPALLGAGMYR